MIQIKVLTLFTLLFTLLIASCVPTSPRSGTGKAALTSSTPATTNGATATTSSNLYWYLGSQITGTLSINSTEDNVGHLRGSSVSAFLNSSSNFSKTFCLVVNYTESGLRPQLRLRAIPFSFTNLQTKTIERALKIDFPNDNDVNNSSCQGSISGVTLPIASAGDATVTNATGNLSKVCASCSGTRSSVSVRLYDASVSNTLTVIDGTKLDLSSLQVRINFSNNNTSANGGSCSDSSCQAQGYDCCSSNQCVNDGALTANYSTDPDREQAFADVAINPMNKVLYPGVYYLCPNIAHATPVPTPPTDSTTTSNTYLAQMKKLYDCQENGYSSSDYATCTTNNIAGYYLDKTKIWKTCGCAATIPTSTSATASEDIVPPTECPDFKLTPVKNGSTVVGYNCLTPVVIVDPTPLQSLSLQLSSRTVPHRFYRDDTGGSVDKIETLPATVMQEGKEFSYLEPLSLSSPENVKFNMNAILGQIKVNLTSALPAQVVTVEYNQSYLIEATNGSYIPCPTCPRDSWFNTFTPFPPSTRGNGLMASGYSTVRDDYVTNSTLGNYEDTHFGRACYVPPTMLPYSHKKFSTSVKDQRLARLETQSALYMNGYQRDWFGFNYGALIGSFDGVSWFAIGTGRKVISKSTKLFLAINAPFGDLADYTNLKVNVLADNGYPTAAEYDFDPTLSPDNSVQNKAGSCQRYHMCNTDSDCVTQIGWEYRCIDVTKVRTNWPKFDSNGNEVLNDQLAFQQIPSILQSFQLTTNNKRCVYRGAGAPCKQDPKTGVTGAEQQKSLTCAPNFYCANLTENRFNEELVRSASPLENILYGQEADVLGRPLNYSKATKALTTTIQNNLTSTLSQYGGTNYGVCRPGKNFSSGDVINQHSQPSTGFATDSINQIGVCNSATAGGTRTQACPFIDMDITPKTDAQYKANHGNFLGDAYSTSVSTLALKQSQNSCGLEIKKTGVSTFKSIEAPDFSTALRMLEPTFNANACLRRAGSPCFSDLDCSPNKFHAGLALMYNNTYFGGTDAEKNYWSESLTCGQAAKEPGLSDSDYYNYDLTKNRCCRAVGKDFTMETGVVTPTTATIVIPELASASSNVSLDVNKFPATNPNTSNYYSRYQVAATSGSLTTQLASANLAAAPSAGKPAINATGTGIVGDPNIFDPYLFQWVTLNNTATKTCCGGSWVRKFADGTHSWLNPNRLKIDYKNFKCLNFNSKLPLEIPSDLAATPSRYYQDFNFLGGYAGDKATYQLDFPTKDDGFEIIGPSAPNATAATQPLEVDMTLFNTTDGKPASLSQMSTAYYKVNDDIPYIPTLAMNQGQPYILDDTTDAKKRVIGINIPIYVDRSSIIDIWVDYYLNGTQVKTISTANAAPNKLNLIACNGFTPTTLNPLPPFTAENQYCIDNTKSIIYVNSDLPNPAAWDVGYLKFAFYNKRKALGRKPGNDLYYLTKLGRLELLGIPQIYYEPLLCNSDNTSLVPGIFKETLSTRALFDDIGSKNYSLDLNPIPGKTGHSSIYQVTDTETEYNTRVAFSSNVAHPAVFSNNKFACCIGVGETTSDTSNCCTGLGTRVGTTSKFMCSIPSGTDLNVYLNKFVSGEGYKEFDGLSFSDADFNPVTGEPKLDTNVYNKIVAFGQKFCFSRTIKAGGAFGNFYAEPNDTLTLLTHSQNAQPNMIDYTRYSIIDSDLDNEDSTALNKTPADTTGVSWFKAGFRWNHHYYCR